MSSLLKELNNNPTQFSRIMEILNGMQAPSNNDLNHSSQIKTMHTKSASFGWTSLVRKNQITEDDDSDMLIDGDK